MHSGSKRSIGWFHLSMGGTSNDSIKEAVLVESPIKTLQLMARNAPHKSRTLYLCVDSEHAPLPTEFLQNIPNITTQLPYNRIIALKNSQSYLMEPLINESSQKNKSQQTIEM